MVPRQHLPLLGENLHRLPQVWFGKLDPQGRDVLALKRQSVFFKTDRRRRPDTLGEAYSGTSFALWRSRVDLLVATVVRIQEVDQPWA